MVKNYLKVAWRNLWRYKMYSFINIFGLAVGMASCILIFLWVKDELSYEDFYKNSKNIYRIIKEDSLTSSKTSFTAPGVVLGLKKDFPEVVKAARFKILISPPNILVNANEKKFLESKIAFTDQDFLEMFTVSFIEGDLDTALTNPKSIVLTRSMAKKYFGDHDPMGKTFTLENQYDFAVTGIVEDIPHNTHLRFDALVPFENIADVMPAYRGTLESIGFHFYRNYIMLREDVSIADFRDKAYGFYERINPEDTQRVLLQPIKDVHLHSAGIKDYTQRSDIRYVYIFTAMGILILLMACINFINLTTSQSAVRAKEVGMRKVLGAYRDNIIRQFLSETILFSLFSLVIAVCLILLFLPSYNSLTGKPIIWNLSQNADTIIAIFLIALTTGIISGSFPSLVFSSFKPILVLKGGLRPDRGKGIFRKILIVKQFIIAVGLMACTLIIYQQFRYIQNKKLGFDKEHMVYVKLNGQLKEKYELARTELLKNSNIKNVAFCSSIMTRGTYHYSNLAWEGMPDNRDVRAESVGYVSVDQDFFETFGLEIIQGRKFRKGSEARPYEELIINESTARIIGANSPIGLRAGVSGPDFPGTIIGVVRDYHFRSLHNEIAPLAICLHPAAYNFMYIKINPSNIPTTIGNIERVLASIEPNFPVDYHFLDEAFDNLYLSEAKMRRVFTYFTALGIIIACLGLFGLVSYSAESRTKEIDIRKVLGASILNIVRLISREFLTLVLVANFIALPAAYFFMSKWLENFSYRIEIKRDSFLVSGSLVIVIALMTITFRSVRAANANPADSLRYE
jgi:putative ABC transport system permease protein